MALRSIAPQARLERLASTAYVIFFLTLEEDQVYKEITL
jgi:hypothetical protein